MLLDGKTALITGCLKGIGYEAMQGFARQGASIVACCQFMIRYLKNAPGNSLRRPASASLPWSSIWPVRTRPSRPCGNWLLPAAGSIFCSTSRA